MANKGIKCPVGHATMIWKKGYYPSRKGRKTRYLCATCGRSFYKETSGKSKSKKSD